MADEELEPRGRPYCRCLLSEFWQEMSESVAEANALLSDEERAPGDVYDARLSECLRCNHLRDGTCALCGCYVESRAAKRLLKCPDVPPRWVAMPKEE